MQFLLLIKKSSVAKRLSSFCFQRHEKILVLLLAIAKILQHCQYWRLWKELLHIIWVVKWQVFKYFRPIKANRACQAEVKKHSSSTTDMKAEFLDCRLCMIFHGNCGSLLLTIERETRDTDYKESCFWSHFIHVCTFVICLKQRNWGPKGRGKSIQF